MDSAALLKKIDQLPRLPKAVSELLDAINNEHSSIKVISAKVAQDPLMSARVLRLANSTHFGRHREVGSIDEAVIRLGMQTLRTLVIASVVIGAVPKVDNLNLGTFWGETFEVALYSQALATHCQVAPDEAFTCGILHNIGDLLIASSDPEMASAIRKAVAAGACKQEAEMSLLDFDAATVGALLAQTWRFTDTLAAGIAHQYQPKNAKDYSKLAGLMYMAKTLLRSWDDIEEDAVTSWLSAQSFKAGLRMDMSGLAVKLLKVKGCGIEMGQQLA